MLPVSPALKTACRKVNEALIMFPQKTRPHENREIFDI
jgi:hypothetical protein